MNALESFQDDGNPWHTVGKKGEIIHDEETPVNKLQRKQPRSKVFELVIFGDSITKRIDPSFIARCDKSLALNYSLAMISKIVHIRNHIPRDHPSEKQPI